MNVEAMFNFIFLKKVWILGFLFLQFFGAFAQENVFLQLKLATDSHKLNFPKLTTKIYLGRFYQSIWFNNDLRSKVLKEATQLLDSAPQYGLNKIDFHCVELSTGHKSFQINSADAYKPSMDIWITDAMLTFIAQLHYGKANPIFPLKSLDQEQFSGLKIDSIFLSALTKSDFKSFIKEIEPKYKAYHDLQKYTSGLVSSYADDCNLIKDENFKLLAINLERWRWLNSMEMPYAIINIPAFTLTYYHQNTTDEFKVIVGKTTTKTPVLTSKIRFFTTAPNWVVPKSIIKKEIIPKALNNSKYFYLNHLSLYDKNGKVLTPNRSNLLKLRANLSDYSVVQSPGISNALGQIKFNFDNSFSVYLHDTPNRDLFNQTDRALSHGCIRVENPEKLVSLFLEDEQKLDILPEVLDAMKRYQRKIVYLHQPVNIAVVYFTAAVKDGVFIVYKDLYQKDLPLVKALEQPLTYL